MIDCCSSRWLLLCAVLVTAGWHEVRADQYSAPFVVESVHARLDQPVYFINAVIAINLPDYIVGAIDQGFDLPLVMEIEGYRHKPMWFDRQFVYIRQQYRIGYHALLDEYSVVDVNSGMRNYYLTFDQAIAGLSVLIDYPALDSNTLSDGERYRMRLRFGIDGDELPLPLKSSSLWKTNWDIKSAWFEWEIRR